MCYTEEMIFGYNEKWFDFIIFFFFNKGNGDLILYLIFVSFIYRDK